MWILLSIFASATARDREPPAEDRVALAGLLVRDGDWERAAGVLAAIDPAAKGVDLQRYWTLAGLVALHEDRAADAATSFEEALAVATEGRELLELHLARARLATGEPEQALAALARPRKRLALASDATYLKCRRRVLEFLYERHRFIEAA